MRSNWVSARFGLWVWKPVGRLSPRRYCRCYDTLLPYFVPALGDLGGIAVLDVICKQERSLCFFFALAPPKTHLRHSWSAFLSRVCQRGLLRLCPALNGCVFLCWGGHHSAADRNKVSEMMEQVAQHSDEERVSLGSNDKTSTRTLGKIGSTLRSSLRRVAERSPLSPGSKGSKVTPPSPSEYQPKKP